MKSILANWKISSLGLIAILAAIGHIIDHFHNGTEIEWTMTASAIVTGLGLMFARQNSVTSEMSGVTPTEVSMENAKEVGSKTLTPIKP